MNYTGSQIYIDSNFRKIEKNVHDFFTTMNNMKIKYINHNMKRNMKSKSS